MKHDRRRTREIKAHAEFPVGFVLVLSTILALALLSGCALAPVTAENAANASVKNLCYRTQDAAARAELERRQIPLSYCQAMIAQRDQALFTGGTALMLQGLTPRPTVRNPVCFQSGVHYVCH